MTQSSEAIVPLGAMRFNSDTQRLEYWNGAAWFQIHTFSPSLDGGVRATFHGGETPTRVDTIDYITISTAGNAIDFGNINTVLRASSACSSNTRAIICSGEDGNTPRPVDLRFITFSSTGGTTDFGDLTVGTRGSMSLSNQIRGITANGSTPSYPGTIDFYSIASTGNARDFGDQVTAHAAAGVASNPTRGLFAGGYSPSQTTDIEFVTIPTKGNAQDFSELKAVRSSLAMGIISSATTGYFAGGSGASIYESYIEKIDFAGQGKATDFGNLTDGRGEPAGVSGNNRGVAAGGYPGPSASNTDVIDYFSLSTGGDAVDFGNLTQARFGCSGASNGHGGLN